MTMADSAARETVLRQMSEAFAHLPAGGDRPGFVERYYHHVPTDELLGRSPQALAGAAASHVAFAQQRPAGTAKVTVFNPTTEVDGWSSPRTVVLVVTDDMPFLVDSVTGALVRRGYDIHLVVHPQLRVRRDAVGGLENITDNDPALAAPSRGVGDIAESWMQLSIDRETDESTRDQLEQDIREVLEDVRETVEDWAKMRTRCLVVAAELEGTPPAGADPDEVARAAEFLRWMAENHFTFLGYRQYRLTMTPDGETITCEPGTGLGILRSDPSASEPVAALSPVASELAHDSDLLVLTKANSLSTVHRNAYMDYVGVKVYDDAGAVVGERRFLGLYAATAYTESVERIPLVRDKVHEVIARSGVSPDSHTGKDLLGVLETYPRDELIQTPITELFETAMAVSQLQERRRTKLFVREDAFRRFVSCLVYIPRDRYNTAVRLRMSDILKEAFGGDSVEFTARVSESALARLMFVVRMPRGERVDPLTPSQRRDLEARLVEVSRTWSDRLADGLRDRLGEVDGDQLMDRFGRGFPTAYQETFTVAQTVADLRHLDRLGDGRRTSVALYRPSGGSPTVRRFKLFRTDPLSLTDVLPIFTHMGVEVIDEQPYAVTREDGNDLHVYDFGLRVTDAQIWEALPHDRLRDLFESAVLTVWDGQAESDGFNRLVLLAQLTWRQVVILRAVAKYLRQTQATFSQDYVEDALCSNPQLAAELVDLFQTRFDPARCIDDDAARQVAGDALAERILAGLDAVASLDHDRIIRSFLSVIRAGLRTNFYQRTPAGEDKAYVSIKLDPTAIPELPAPRPQFEIWVYGPRVEGVHLRFGPVARGGLRWSDRREDFRTEILGLVKAQMVKNAVIVPTGSKGGFFPKLLPDPSADRAAWLAEGVAAYRQFISGLLDLTDNRAAGQIVPPADVVRHDGDDSYLVVAADKGTATFSDIANGVARDDGFWLDDAFASGGSAGYDHKAMGITARGAWESVKRHFRELGVDTQRESVTVVGVGDMSGDVFGNGMLLSEHLRLVAAFDHRDIFIDPDPDPAVSYAERERLFHLPRSSWADYDASLISPGGGVFSRSLKSVSVTEPMRAALGLGSEVTTMTPADLIHAILLAPVDLLWNGGIGTYVKATVENNVDVGDRANDGIRVNGEQLRVAVVGEGGNLGLTQLGRVEAARHGVRVNTDAIDNSAGVDTSDHEVNIKIPLAELMRGGELIEEVRNTFLMSMTDEVADAVLRDNYEQNVLLGNARAQEHIMVPVHIRLMHWLEDRGLLDRALEFLPSDADLRKRFAEGHGLTSPEFSVLVAYAKLGIKDDLLAGSLPDDPWFTQTLADYFPVAMQQAYGPSLQTHPLRREIITNAVANSLVNRGGITFAFRAMEETGATVEHVAQAFVVAREVFDLAGFVSQVEALDNVVPTAAQTRLYLEFRRLLDRAVRWLLHSRPSRLDIAVEIERFAATVQDWGPRVPGLLTGAEQDRLRRRAAEFAEGGIPEDLAVRAAALLDLYDLLDIADIVTDTGHAIDDVAPLYYQLSETFGIDAMLHRVTRLPREDQWDALARAAVRDDLYGVLESLTRSVLQTTGEKGGSPQERLETWVAENHEAIERGKRALTGIVTQDAPNLAALSVALRTLRGIIRTGSAS
ncbi:MAG: NAD-glutamate dehydrogenase [Nostocoides sp.]